MAVLKVATNVATFTATLIYFVICGEVLGTETSGGTVKSCDEVESFVVGNRGTISYVTAENGNCEWNIRIPYPGSLTLIMKEIAIPALNEETGECFPHQFLQIAAKKGKTRALELCGKSVDNLSEKTFRFSSNEVQEIQIKLSIKTDFKERNFTIFSMEYFLDCDQVVSEESGRFQSPNYPQKYYHGLECLTRFNLSKDSTIRIYFVELNVKSDDARCQQDFVEIARTEGKTERVCDKKLPEGSVFIDPAKDVIRFVSDDSDDGGVGFVANWVTAPTTDEPSTPTSDNETDLTWIALVFFGAFVLGAIIFTLMWSRKRRPRLPQTPDSQCSSTVFKFDDLERQHSFRMGGDEMLSPRSSVRGRISKKNKWDISNSVIAKKRAATAFHRQFSDCGSTPTRALQKQISMDGSYICSPIEQFSPPPRYDSYFGFYSTRRARVIQSPYLPRSAGYSTERRGSRSVDSLDCESYQRKERGPFSVRRFASARESRKMWRSTDSIPERWRVNSPSSLIETKMQDQFKGSAVVVPLNDTGKADALDQLEKQAYERTIDATKVAEADISEIHIDPNLNAILYPQHASADDILHAIKENSAEDVGETIALNDGSRSDSHGLEST